MARQRSVLWGPQAGHDASRWIEVGRWLGAVSLVVASVHSGSAQSVPPTRLAASNPSDVGAGSSDASIGQYSPSHPVVRDLIRGGLAVLESAQHDALGEFCLASLALMNDGAPRTHPKIVETLQKCVELSSDLSDDLLAEDIYSTGLAITFLCSYDATGQRDLIGQYVKSLNQRQKAQGGWGYATGEYRSTCDTSQTQYAILALWYLQHTDAAAFPADVVARACNWLLVTQDPSGAWGYQGNEATGSQRNPQTEIRHSLCAAGLSSVYLCANMLHLTRPPRSYGETAGIGPFRPATQSAGDDGAGSRQLWAPRTRDVPLSRLKSCLAEGNAWFDRHFQFDDTEWTFYYMYAFERYRSFREIADGKTEASPDWYNIGVEYLIKTRTTEGGWNGKGGLRIDTSFAVLFLQRSTQKVLETLRDGRLTGGRGLPQDLREATLRGGKIQGKQFEGSLNDLIAALDSPDLNSTLETVSPTEAMTLSEEPVERQRQLESLRRLVAHDSQASRLAAVALLATTDNLQEVPYLIYALTDPDPLVVRAARDGLRRMSRKFNGFGLPDQPTRAEILRATDDWKAWYRTLRPDAQFLE